MALQKWRNPYSPLNKKGASVGVKPASVSVTTTPKNTKLPILDLRQSVTKMRNNLKGISSTIRQMEETMDTLYGAMDVFESLGRSTSKNVTPAKKSLPATQTIEEDLESSESTPTKGNTSPLSNIDIGQLLSLLQSPLVQSLLTQSQSSGNKRKKEGS